MLTEKSDQHSFSLFWNQAYTPDRKLSVVSHFILLWNNFYKMVQLLDDKPPVFEVPNNVSAGKRFLKTCKTIDPVAMAPSDHLT